MNLPVPSGRGFSAGRFGFLHGLETCQGIGFVVNKLEDAVETSDAENVLGCGGGVAENEPSAGGGQKLVKLYKAGKAQRSHYVHVGEVDGHVAVGSLADNFYYLVELLSDFRLSR